MAAGKTVLTLRSYDETPFTLALEQADGTVKSYPYIGKRDVGFQVWARILRYQRQIDKIYNDDSWIPPKTRRQIESKRAELARLNNDRFVLARKVTAQAHEEGEYDITALAERVETALADLNERIRACEAEIAAITPEMPDDIAERQFVALEEPVTAMVRLVLPTLPEDVLSNYNAFDRLAMVNAFTDAVNLRNQAATGAPQD